MVLLRAFADDQEAFSFLEGLPLAGKVNVVDHFCEILLEGDATPVAPDSTVASKSLQAKELTRRILRAMTFTPDLFFSYLDVSKFGGKKGTSDESPATPNGDAGSTSGKKRRRGKGDASPASSGPSSKKKKKGEEDVVDGEGAAVEYSEEAVSLHIRKLTLVLEMLQPRVAAMAKNESLVPHLLKVLKFFVQDKPATTTDNG